MFSSFLNWKYLKNWLQGSFYRLFLSYTELCQNDLKVTFQRRALLALLINRNSHFSRTDLWKCKVNQGLIIISNNRVNNFPHINTYITQKVTLKFVFFFLFSVLSYFSCVHSCTIQNCPKWFFFHTHHPPQKHGEVDGFWQVHIRPFVLAQTLQLRNGSREIPFVEVYESKECLQLHQPFPWQCPKSLKTSSIIVSMKHGKNRIVTTKYIWECLKGFIHIYL